MQELGLVGSYMEDLMKPENCQNWEEGASTEMSICSVQYGSCGILIL